jgi:hypothetical protein
LARVRAPDVVIDDAPEVYYQHRRDGDDDIYFFVNTSLERTFSNAKVRLPSEGVLEVWDAVTGERSSLPAVSEAGGLRLTLDFAPAGSHLVVRRARGTDALAVARRAPKRFRATVDLDGGWGLQTLDRNAVVLDYCEVRIGAGDYGPRVPTWQAHQYLIRAGIGTPFTLRFSFRARTRAVPLSLALEDAERFSVTVNGKAIETDQRASVWWDPRLPILDISAAVRTGENVVEISGCFGLDSEIESCYVVGEFRADRRNGFEIGSAAKRVRGTNLVDEGYPFFVGRAVLSTQATVPRDFERAYLRLRKLDAIVAAVRVNGADAGRLAWKPYLLDVTDHVKPGRNRIEIELATSLHNALGPHHSKLGEVRHFVIDREWSDACDWTDDYFFVPVGVTGAALVFS